MRDCPRHHAVHLGVSGLRILRQGRPKLAIDMLDLACHGPTVILGPNGAGKSLLLRVLHGLIRPGTGTVYQDGQVLDRAARARQAMVFQHPVLLRRSVAANLAFVLHRRGIPRRVRADRVAALLDHGGLSEKARQPARSLSGGEAQRLAFLRAMACAPEVLFLDEPTSALDPASTAGIEHLIRAAVAAGMRVVMVTHDIGQAKRLAEEVVFLAAGHLIEQAPADRFFHQPQSPEARQYLAGGLIL